MCDEQSGTGTDVSLNTSVFLYPYDSTIARHTFTLSSTLYGYIN